MIQSVNVSCVLWDAINGFVENDSSVDNSAIFTKELNKSLDNLKNPNPFVLKPCDATVR